MLTRFDACVYICKRSSDRCGVKSSRSLRAGSRFCIVEVVGVRARSWDLFMCELVVNYTVSWRGREERPTTVGTTPKPLLLGRGFTLIDCWAKRNGHKLCGSTITGLARAYVCFSRTMRGVPSRDKFLDCSQVVAMRPVRLTTPFSSRAFWT